jgi:hypothetical protein
VGAVAELRGIEEVAGEGGGGGNAAVVDALRAGPEHRRSRRRS